MALRIRRGTDAQRSGVTFNSGEIVWTTDEQKLWVGDGVTQGGRPAVGSNITGYGLSYDVQTHKIEVAGLSADDLTNGTNNKFFSSSLVEGAVGPMFTTGSHTGISFQYDSGEGTINATVTLDGVGIARLQDDTVPTLGGNLTLNSNNINGIGDIDITGNITTLGIVEATAVNSPNISNGSVTFEGGGALFTDAAFTLGENVKELGITYLSNVASNSIFTLKSLTAGVTSTGSSIEHLTSRGSLTSPAVVQAADALGLSSAWGYDGGSYTQSSIVGMFVDPNGTVGSEAVPGMIGLINFVDTNPANYRAVFINRNGWLTIGRAITDDAKAHVDINGVMLLAKQSVAPANPYEGMIAVADGSDWDPCSVGGLSYPTYYNGNTWIKMFS